MEDIKRIGLLGGTFDPVHNGHLAAAAEVRMMLNLDEVCFIPAAMPPHKPDYELTAFTRRAVMLDLAVVGQPGFKVLYLESELPKPSYTIDTLKELHLRLGPDVYFYFILGADAFLEIATWKAYDRLLSLTDFAVLARPPYTLELVADSIREFFPECRYDSNHGVWQTKGEGPGAIHLLAPGPYSVSSTLIREMVRSGKPISGLVPQAVEAFIVKHGLYV